MGQALRDLRDRGRTKGLCASSRIRWLRGMVPRCLQKAVPFGIQLLREGMGPFSGGHGLGSSHDRPGDHSDLRHGGCGAGGLPAQGGLALASGPIPGRESDALAGPRGLGQLAYFDITGTMWIVSLFMLFGMKGIGSSASGASSTRRSMTFMGKWIRRSNVVTGAEWMRTRFGTGQASEWARASYALLAVVTLIAFIAYSSVGMGKFGTAFLPGWTENQCALLIVGAVAIYATLGGFASIVLIDLVHTIVLSLGVVAISVFAFVTASHSAAVQKVATSDWGSIVPSWTMPAVKGYEMFGVLLIMWVAKGMIQELGGPPQMFDFQRFLAARDSRDACKIGALWGIIHILRWPLVASIVVLALAAGLGGETDMEKVLPLVLQKHLPAGFPRVHPGRAARRVTCQRWTPSSTRGARTWSATSISAMPGPTPGRAAGLRRLRGLDIPGRGQFWDHLRLRGQDHRHDVRVDHARPRRRGDDPCVLRWYWWRFNGWGFTAGILLGIVTAIAQALWFPKAPIWVYFPAVAGANLAACVAVTLLTRPTDRDAAQALLQVGPARRLVGASRRRRGGGGPELLQGALRT